MNRVVFAVILLVFPLAACGSPERGAPPVGQAAIEPESVEPQKIPVRGIVASAGGVTTFTECGAPRGAAKILSDPAGELAKALASLEAKPEVGIYVELSGAPAADGRSFAWTALLRAGPAGARPACDGPVFEGEFVANGNEPFWTIEIREGGIVYRDPEVPKGRTYPYAFTRTETGSVVYATKLDAPVVSTLEIALAPSRCIDSMSGELRSFKAHVVQDGRTLEGCARAGVPHGEFGSVPLDELNRFTGAYPRTVHLWSDGAIRTRLEALLGPAMEEFLENMKVQSPLMKDAGVFYVTGNRPHYGGLDNAIFLADPSSDTIEVILFKNRSRRDFKEGGRDVALPAEVDATIDNMAPL